MTATIVHNFSPLNDIARTAFLEGIDETGAVVPITAGSVTAFLATSSGDTAEALDPTLEVAAVHIGSSDEGALYPLGTWLFEIDGDALVPELFDGVKDKTAYYLIAASAGVRVYERVLFYSGRAATIA